MSGSRSGSQPASRCGGSGHWPIRLSIAQGKTVADVCRVIEVTQLTYHRWKQQYGGIHAKEAKRLTQLEKENARL
jgi:transposase-like protein